MSKVMADHWREKYSLACKDLQALQSRIAELQEELSSGHYGEMFRAYREVREENSALRKVVEAARELHKRMKLIDGPLTDALKELDGERD